MADRLEALTSVLVAARALQRHGPTNALLAALFSAVDAVDACVVGSPVPGMCQADPACWRRVEVGTTCFQHSAIAQQPHPWESLRRRDATLSGGDDGQ